MTHITDENQHRIVLSHSNISDRKRGEVEAALREQAAKRMEGLTPRERQVLKGIAAGKLNKTIASDLGLSPKTVEKHRSSLRKKLKVRSVAELVRIAVTADPAI